METFPAETCYAAAILLWLREIEDKHFTLSKLDEVELRLFRGG